MKPDEVLDEVARELEDKCKDVAHWHYGDVRFADGLRAAAALCKQRAEELRAAEREPTEAERRAASAPMQPADEATIERRRRDADLAARSRQRQDETMSLDERLYSYGRNRRDLRR